MRAMPCRTSISGHRQVRFESPFKGDFQTIFGRRRRPRFGPPAAARNRACRRQTHSFRRDLHGRHEPSGRLGSAVPAFTSRRLRNHTRRLYLSV